MHPDLFAHLDGYGLGVPIITQIPGVDIDTLASEFELEESLDPDSRTLLYRVVGDEMEAVPHWNELDLTTDDGDRQALYTRPAVILEPNTRYIVAYRNIVDATGATIEPSPAFRVLRDRRETDNTRLDGRRAHYEELFARLESVDVERSSLYLAWDFHTGSEESLHARLDQSIEAAFNEVGADGPTFDIADDEVTLYVAEDDESEDPVHANVRAKIATKLTVPSVLRTSSLGNAELNIDESGEVAVNGTREINVRVLVPHVAETGDEDMGVIIYGHGLLGGPGQINASHLEAIAQSSGYIFVAAALTGMSEEDVDDVILLSSDMNRFPTISDGLHQGITEYHLVTRAARRGLEAALDEHLEGVTIDSDRTYYFGASQGGIFGGTYLATSPDVHRGLLAVPGNNYSTLLSRSVNFAEYFSIIAAAYTDPIDQRLVIASMQLLWDTTDPVSYYHRMFLDTEPQAEALFTLSKGDKQVAVVTNENLARTFPEELAVMENYDSERDIPYVDETAYPHTGNAMILFDFGNAWPIDRANLPPVDELPDPHSRQAELEELGPLLEQFFETGVIEDVCDGDGCTPL